MPLLSVIIPTHKRPQILKQCLERLEQQTVAEDLEVIVVSDGPDTETHAMITEKKWAIPVHYADVKKSQQGTARNCGVRKASADTVLFIGDDMFLEPNACEAHIQSAIRNPQSAILGFITWDPSVGITPVMRWLEQSGWQFGYPKIKQYAHGAIPAHIQHLFTYTGNISLPTSIAKRITFREDITDYGWEDIEWGKRLAKEGIPLFYEPSAVALHHHRLELRDSLKRMETLGKSAKNYPSIARVPTGWKRVAYRITALLPTTAGIHRKAFLKGIRNG